jgi:hypothetical protein
MDEYNTVRSQADAAPKHLATLLAEGRKVALSIVACVHSPNVEAIGIDAKQRNNLRMIELIYTPSDQRSQPRRVKVTEYTESGPGQTSYYTVPATWAVAGAPTPEEIIIATYRDTKSIRAALRAAGLQLGGDDFYKARTILTAAGLIIPSLPDPAPNHSQRTASPAPAFQSRRS